MSELRERIAPLIEELRTRPPPASAGLRFQHLPTPTGVGPLIEDPANAGAVFQAASQFNCLEMTGPGVSPRQGIAIYAGDPTQGPKCALACPAGTVFRNYIVDVGDGKRGQGEQQIDCLAGVGAVLGNDGAKYWTMKNGYALPSTSSSMRELGGKLRKDAELLTAAEEALRVGVHWDTQTKPPKEHRVCQVYASALPVAYAPNARAADWEPFARLVLRSAYAATLAVAVCKAKLLREQSGGAAPPRIAVFLTSLGGGAFGNRHEWIRDALVAALDLFRDAPLDVTLVHYGTRVPSDWETVRGPTTPGAASSSVAPSAASDPANDSPSAGAAGSAL